MWKLIQAKSKECLLLPAVRCQSVTIEDTSTTTKTVSIIAPVSIIASIAPSNTERERDSMLTACRQSDCVLVVVY